MTLLAFLQYILAANALAGLGFIAFMTGMLGVIYIIVWQPWVKVEAVRSKLSAGFSDVGGSND